MVKKLSNFFKILSIEFMDLEEGLEAHIRASEERYEKREITSYVHKENTALLEREISDIRILRERVQSLSEREFTDLDNASEEIIKVINSFAGIPHAVHRYMEKKVYKVLEYVNVLEK